MIEYKEKGTS